MTSFARATGRQVAASDRLQRNRYDQDDIDGAHHIKSSSLHYNVAALFQTLGAVRDEMETPDRSSWDGRDWRGSPYLPFACSGQFFC